MLNNLRLKAKIKGEKDQENDLRNALADIALLRCGIAPDWEIEEKNMKKARWEYME